VFQIEYGFKGKVTIRKRYSYVDIKSLAEPLSEGETLEFNNIHIGNTLKKGTKCRLILTKLTEECKRKKDINNKKMKFKMILWDNVLIMRDKEWNKHRSS